MMASVFPVLPEVQSFAQDKHETLVYTFANQNFKVRS